MKFQITKRRARAIIVIIWIVALTTTIPWAMYFNLFSANPPFSDIVFCAEQWPSKYAERVYFIVGNIIFCYLLPLLLITICYVMIWIKVRNRSIPTENKNGHIERMQQRSKVSLSFFFKIFIFAAI